MNHRRILLALILGLVCTGSAKAQLPVSDSDFVGIHPPVTEVSVDSTNKKFNVAIMVDNSTVLGAISLPLTFSGLVGLNIDTTVVTLGNRGVTYGPAGRSVSWVIKTSFLNSDQGILLGFISFSQFDPTDDTLCYVHFDVTPGTDGSVTLDSGNVNNQSMGFTSVLAFEFTPTWSAGVFQFNMGSGLPGDMNCDFKVTIGDIIYLVNYIFKSGPEPCLPDAADVDCDDQLAVSDAIYLVNYLFRGGPSPRSACE